MIFPNLKLLLLFFTLILSLASGAKKKIFPIEIVSAISDLIVVGQIKSFTPNTYELVISETIKGSSRKIITVVKFEEWTCDVRFGDYKRGQQLLLFLKRKGDYYEIVNASTGEIPIKYNYITLNYESLDEKRFIPYKMSLKECINGLLYLNQCYEMIGSYDGRSDFPFFRKIGNNLNISSKNQFSTFLIKQMKRYKFI